MHIFCLQSINFAREKRIGILKVKRLINYIMIMKKVYVYALPALVAGTLGLSSCSSVDDDGIGIDAGPKKPEAEYFDFSTTKDVTLNLNFGEIAANSLVSVYVNQPSENASEGTAFSIFTDSKGCFQGKASLPAHADSVWVSIAALGLPEVTPAKVVNGQVSIDYVSASAASTGARGTRAATDNTLESHLVNASKRLYTIVKYAGWNGTNVSDHGAIDYNWNSAIFSNGKVKASVVNDIKKALWGNNAVKPSGLDNSALTRDTKHVNTSIAKAYEDANGKIQTVESAQVYLTFLHERAHYRNVIGYYYYKTDEAPASPDDVDKYIIVPNASIGGDHPYAEYYNRNSIEYYANAPLLAYGENGATNMRTQLLFKDPETGEMKKEFPAGYTIGYFIISDGFWVKDGANRDMGHVNVDCQFMYSNNEWNPGQFKRFISMTIKDDGTVVYGIEDGNDDKSYDDVMFTIDADPNFAIQDPDRPSVEPEQGEIYSTEVTYRTYAFEDIWPDGGDYDMNDVVVTHKRSVTFGNASNEITQIVDEFSPVQPAGSAEYTNAFAVTYSAKSTSINYTGMTLEPETNSIIVTKNTNADRNKVLTVTRTFSGLSKNTFVEDINPFVIPKYVDGAKTRSEVHLPKHSATSKVDPALSLTGHDAWYVDADGLFPFAISLPVQHYAPANEGIRIDKYYSRYASWVTSKGEKDSDWYLDHSE